MLAEVDTTRLVLLTDSYPDLRLFAKTVAKVQSASDLLKLAYAAVVLELERRIARKAPSTQDPLESLLEVVRSMQGSPEMCVLALRPCCSLEDSASPEADLHRVVVLAAAATTSTATACSFATHRRPSRPPTSARARCAASRRAS